MMKFQVLCKNWYALHTRSRFENVVSIGLEKKSLEIFYPQLRVLSRRRDRRVMIDVPLFPGYLFVRSDLRPAEHLEILKTTGVVRMVGNTAGPVPVSDQAIASLRIMVVSGSDIATGMRFRPGDPVMVIRGPLTGVVGIFQRYRGRERVVVHIEALGQFAAVHVDLADIEPLRGANRIIP